MPEAAGSLQTQLLDALKSIPDPELGVNIVDLGLVYDVAFENGCVVVTYTLTTMGCGIGPILESQMREVLSGLPGVSEVIPKLVMEPRWTRDRMSPKARAVVGDRELRPPNIDSLWDRLLPREAPPTGAA